MINNEIVNLNVNEIIPNKNQPRKNFDEEALKELSLSIQSYGIIQPITVRKMTDGLYELIAGERRLKAVKLLKWETVPAVIMEADEEDSAAMALIENLQRQDLSFIEEAIAYDKLTNEFNMTQQQIAEKVGKSQSTIANKMRLLKLPEKAREKIKEGGLNERHARALLKIEDEDVMCDIIDRIIKKDLNVSASEKLIQSVVEDMQKDKLKDRKYVRNFINYKIYINTIKNAYNEIVKTGVNAEFKQEESDEFIELKVRIPKSFSK